jgi:predicted transcriptional regulator
MDGQTNIPANTVGATAGFTDISGSVADRGLLFTGVASIVVALAGSPNGGLTVENAPKLVGDLVNALNGQATAAGEDEAPQIDLVPAVPIKKSITPDALISLENGQKYKSLKRHLSSLGMTPEDYRRKWSLPSDYPMVAANYSALRADRARQQGLGSKAAAAATTTSTPRRKTA